MVSLTAEEVLLDIPEKSSPTFIIKDVLCELAAEVEVPEAQGTKEEGPSSTPVWEDNEGVDTLKEDWLVNVPSQHVKHQHEMQEEQIWGKHVEER